MKRTSKFLISIMALLLCVAVVLPASASRYATLRPGAEGEMVQALQSGLKALGYPIGVDGKFGRQTTQYVTAFQRHIRLTADGLAGNATLSELFRQVPQFKPDQTGPVVTAPPSNPSVPGVPEASQPGTGTAYVYTSNRGSLNVRSAPRHVNNTIAQLPFGTQVSILGVTGAWTQISANGVSGYVMSSFLRKSSTGGDPGATTTPGPTPNTPSNPPVNPGTGIGTALVITGNRGSLNLRDRASYSGRALLQIPIRQASWARPAGVSQAPTRTPGFVVMLPAPSVRQHSYHPGAHETPSPSPTQAPAPNLRTRLASPLSTHQQAHPELQKRPARPQHHRTDSFGEALILIKRSDWCEVIYNASRAL